MKINKDNYEAYFLDFTEGNLSPLEAEELMAFIEQFPELRSELDSFENISLVPEKNIVFDSKESLKKIEAGHLTGITAENIDSYLIAEIEGVISVEEKNELNSFISVHSNYQKDRLLYSHTLLTPDLSIKYSNKELLKHKAIAVDGITESNYEQLLVEELEGIISAEKKIALNNFLQLNPHLENERKILSHSILIPDKSITFDNKDSIKKKVVPVRRIILYTLAAAASVTLFLTVPNIWNAINNPAEVQQLSQVEPLNKDKEAIIVKPSEGIPQLNVPVKVVSDNSSSKQSRSANSAQETQRILITEDVPKLSLLASHDIISHDYVEPEFKFVRTSQMHSNEYIELYYNLKLAEQIQYAQINESDKNPEKTLINSFTSRVGEFFALNRKSTPSSSPGVSVWTLAELGVKTYNNITQDNVKLDLQRDEEGKVVNYNLYGDKLDLQRDIKK